MVFLFNFCFFGWGLISYNDNRGINFLTVRLNFVCEFCAILSKFYIYLYIIYIVVYVYNVVIFAKEFRERERNRVVRVEKAIQKRVRNRVAKYWTVEVEVGIGIVDRERVVQ